MTHRQLWIASGVLAGILLVAGLVHLAFRTSAQLYLNMHETDEKQTKWIGELYRKTTELERKLAVFEQHIKFETKAMEEKK